METRVLVECTPEEEITARLYAQGMEKKEIAFLKCRAISTINNQLQAAFEKLKVKNGRELATKLYERLSGLHLTMDFNQMTRSVVAGCLLILFMGSMFNDQFDMRRCRQRTRIERVRRFNNE